MHDGSLRDKIKAILHSIQSCSLETHRYETPYVTESIGQRSHTMHRQTARSSENKLLKTGLRESLRVSQENLFALKEQNSRLKLKLADAQNRLKTKSSIDYVSSMMVDTHQERNRTIYKLSRELKQLMCDKQAMQHELDALTKILKLKHAIVWKFVECKNR